MVQLIAISPNTMSCPVVHSIDYSTTLQISDPFYTLLSWNEISGTAISPTQIAPSGYPVMFGHNDGPESTKTFAAWDSGTGKRLKTINMETNAPNMLPIKHEDWEDMTIGKCGPDTDESCIYIADTGDNKAQGTGFKTQRPLRRPYTIYKIREPMLDNIFDNSTMLVETHVSMLQFNYSHSSSPTPYANCEAMFIDHTGWGEDGQVGDLYLVTKWNDERSQLLNRMFKIPASAWPDGFGKIATYEPFTVGEYSDATYTTEPWYNFPGSFYNYTWTGADMSLDGTKIAMTWVNETHIFTRCPGESVASAVAKRGLLSCTNYENPKQAANPGNQFESVSFSPDGKRLFNLAESLDPPKIVHVDLDYTITRSQESSFCPDYVAPTNRPTPRPSPGPTNQPTAPPTNRPTPRPSTGPSNRPTAPPTNRPTPWPTTEPPTTSARPTRATVRPTATALELDPEEYSRDDDEFIETHNSYGGLGNLDIPGEKVEVSSCPSRPGTEVLLFAIGLLFLIRR